MYSGGISTSMTRMSSLVTSTLYMNVAYYISTSQTSKLLLFKEKSYSRVDKQTKGGGGGMFNQKYDH